MRPSLLDYDVFQSGPICGWLQRARCSKYFPVLGSITESSSGDHWLPFRTSNTAQPCKNSEGKVWLEAAKCDTLMLEWVWCAIGVGGSSGVGTAGGSLCTLGDQRNIGDDGIVRCRSARGSF